MTTYGVLRHPPTATSPYGSANPWSAVAYALRTTSTLVRVAWESPDVSSALARSRSLLSCDAIRRGPAAERSVSWARRGARAPVSMPRDVALSGNRRRRLSASSSSSARASASMVVAGALAAGSLLHPDVSGTTAVEASAASASRRLINEGFTRVAPMSRLIYSGSRATARAPRVRRCTRPPRFLRPPESRCA